MTEKCIYRFRITAGYSHFISCTTIDETAFSRCEGRLDLLKRTCRQKQASLFYETISCSILFIYICASLVIWRQITSVWYEYFPGEQIYSIIRNDIHLWDETLTRKDLFCFFLVSSFLYRSLCCHGMMCFSIRDGSRFSTERAWWMMQLLSGPVYLNNTDDGIHAAWHAWNTWQGSISIFQRDVPTGQTTEA